MAERRVIRELLVRLGVIGDGNAAKRLKAFDTGIKALARSTVQLGVNLGVAALSARVLAANLGSRAFQANANRLAQGFGFIESMVLRGVDAFERFDAGIGIINRRIVENARMLTRQADALSLSTDEFQQLQFAFREFDLTSDDVTSALTRFGRQAFDALDRTSASAEVAGRKFRQLGITLEELKDRNPLEVMELVAEKLKHAPDKDKGVAAVYDLLGEDLGLIGDGLAQRLVPALQGGAEGITNLRREARDLGLVIDRDLLEAGAKLATQWTTLKGQIRALSDSLGLTLAPMVSRFVQRAQDWIKANQAIIKLRFEQTVWLINGAVERLWWLMSKVDWNLVFAGFLTAGGIAQVAATLLSLLATIIAVSNAVYVLRLGVRALRFAFNLMPPSLAKTIIGMAAYAASATAAWLASLPLSSALGVIALAIGAVLLPLGLLVLVVDDFLSYLRGGRSAIGAYLEWAEKFAPHLREIPGLFRSMGRAMSAWGNLVYTLFTEVLAGVLDAFGMDAQGILDLFESWGPYYQQLAEFFRGVTDDTNRWAESVEHLTQSLKGLRHVISAVLKGDFSGTLKALGAMAEGVEGPALADDVGNADASAGALRKRPSALEPPRVVLAEMVSGRASATPSGTLAPRPAAPSVVQHNTFNGVHPTQQRQLEGALRRHATEAVREGRVQ